MRILLLIALVLSCVCCDNVSDMVATHGVADEPVITTTHNLRIRFETETNQVIVAWISYEEDGHRTVTRRIEIPK